MKEECFIPVAREEWLEELDSMSFGKQDYKYMCVGIYDLEVGRSTCIQASREKATMAEK